MDLNIKACVNIDLSMKHGIRHKNQEIWVRNTNKTRNMQKKAINHVIQAKIARQMLEKDLEC